MTAKARFMNKLQAQQPRPRGFENKGQADIAEFRLRMSQLYEQIETWLTDTGIQTESRVVSLIELLIGGRAFQVPGILLRYQNRTITFTPVFLYGQGVTGCVEVSLCADGHTTPLCRLFMRAGKDVDWTVGEADAATGRRAPFGEEAFFSTIEPLLP